MWVANPNRMMTISFSSLTKSVLFKCCTNKSLVSKWSCNVSHMMLSLMESKTIGLQTVHSFCIYFIVSLSGRTLRFFQFQMLITSVQNLTCVVKTCFCVHRNGLSEKNNPSYSSPLDNNTVISRPAKYILHS